VSNNPSAALNATDSEGSMFSINITTNPDDSYFFSRLTAAERTSLTTNKWTFNGHNWSVLPQTYNSDSGMNSFYKATSTSVDNGGIVFVSSIEAYKYPFMGAQWHSEIDFTSNPTEASTN